ncbi:STY17-like protein [Mya arenaria]|uniref:STY17-like protein n=1 Tax=Mya arenaria TaxID=6604 RepID=A0ABY7FEZ7_MYAAR|nr:STY17-like protein [Mya arenaria]
MDNTFNSGQRESFSSNRDIRTDLPVISGDTFKVAFEQALYRINRRSVIVWMDNVLAIKELRGVKMDQKRVRAFSAEMELICGIAHPNIVRYIGFCDESPNISIIMEYMSMTLYDALHLRHDIDFTDNERLQIIRQMCEDMTPKQVLLNYQNGKDCVAKLSAFGLSKIKNNVDMTSSVAGAKTNQKSAIPRYSAPEVLSGEILKIPDIMKADIWSLALLLHEVIFEEEPYFDMSYKTLLKEVGTKGVTPKGLSDVHTDDTVSVAQKRALSFNPAKRPDITYICQILKDIDNIYKDCA